MNNIFDRNLLRIHRNYASYNISNYDFLIRNSADQIFDHAVALNSKYNEILDLGARNGILTSRLMNHYSSADIMATDISSLMLGLNPSNKKLILDEENLLIASKFDLITSVLNAHWINNLPRFFKLIKDHLNSNGIFIFSMFCATTLKNLRHTILEYESKSGAISSPHISPFVDQETIYKLLQHAGFSFIILDSETIEVEYDNPISLMKDLKGMGESNNLIKSYNIIPRKVLKALIDYPSTFIDHFKISTVIAR